MSAALAAAVAGQAVLLAVANAAHCAGMCGPFATHAARAGGAAGVRGQLSYVAGKTTTYVALGALAGAAGARALALGHALAPWLALGAGLLLAAAGLRALFPRAGLSAGGAALARWLAPLLGALRRRDLPGGRFTLGAVSGAIPCGVVALALAQALAVGAPAGAAGYMLAFGLGTWPALACAGWLLGLGARRLHFAAAGGVLLLAAATLTLWRAGAGFTDASCALCPHP